MAHLSYLQSWSSSDRPSLPVILTGLVIIAYVCDVLLGWLMLRRGTQLPLAGLPNAVPKFVHSFNYATNATSLFQQSYTKFRNKAYKVFRNDGAIVLLPQYLLEELTSIPTTVANPQAALERDLLGHYTGVSLILENRLHHWIVQRRLTPRLPMLIPRMESAVNRSFNELFPQGSEWTEIQPYQLLGRVAARVAADATVGPAFCDDPEWLEIAFYYTENLFRTIVVLRSVPNFLQPAIVPMLPSYWAGRRYLKKAKQLLGPRIRDLMEKKDNGTWEADDTNHDDANLLSWLASLVTGKDRDPETIAHVLVLIALASVHTTLLRMVNVLYDVTAAEPGLKEELMTEISDEVVRGWSPDSYDRLERLDSVLRESQRLSPPTMLGLKRLFQEPYTFKDGTRIPAGTYTCLPIHAIENDPAYTENPDEYDGLRSYRAKQDLKLDGKHDKASLKPFLFSTPTPSILGFGHGKTACPGRFFASCVIKMVVVKMFSEYEFQFMPGTGRPPNMILHEFLFTWPWQKVLARRIDNASSPF